MFHPSSTSRSLISHLVPLLLMLVAPGALQAELAMTITLNGNAEVPPVATAATASGRITVLPDRSVIGSIKTTGMVPSMAHIHEGAVGKNGPAIITLSIAPDKSYAVPAGTTLSEAQYKSYSAGNLYVNVHSAQHPDGEIRAQLLGKPMRLAN